MPQMCFFTYRYMINHSLYFYCIHAASIYYKCFSKSVNTARLCTVFLILYHTKLIYVKRGSVYSNHSCAHYAAVNTTEVNKQHTHCQWYAGMSEGSQPTQVWQPFQDSTKCDNLSQCLQHGLNRYLRCDSNK